MAKSDLVDVVDEGGRDGSRGQRRWLADSRAGVGADGAAFAARPVHPLGCHNPRVPDRDAMNAILLVLRTGMQRNALDATGVCSCASAYRRFREWAAAGVFLEFWRQGLLAYDSKHGIEWEWLALDGAMGKAPLGGSLTGPNPTDRAKKGRNDRCSPRVRASRSGSRRRART